MNGATSLAPLLGGVLIGYLILMAAIGWWARGRIRSAEDFLVAGRRLPLLLAWPTLLATWFGAGTLLTATDEVRAGGLRMAALDPIGAGLCLVLAGLWLARPLWEMRLLTFADFFRARFGARAELWAGLLMVPTYFGWIAAQFVALAGLLELLFGIDPVYGILLVAAVGAGYTLLGGMWSVTLTDAVQMALVVAGLVFLSLEVAFELGGGPLGALRRLGESLPADRLTLVPTEDARALVGWLGVLAIGALGNLPGQDLVQRIFASRSSKTAVWACHLAGASYLTIGALPIFLGLGADLLHPGHEGESTLGLLAGVFLSPVGATILLLAVISSVLSTIDSAILSPASVLAQNILPRTRLGHGSDLARNRWSVAAVTVGAIVTAYLGEDAYGLLEDAYALGLVSLLVPLLAGLWWRRGGESAALASMLVGTSVWAAHAALGWESFGGPALASLALPTALTAAILAGVAYGALARRQPRSEPSAEGH